MLGSRLSQTPNPADVKYSQREMLRVMKLHRVAWRSGVPVIDRTWLQLMCCAPLRPWCPNLRGQGYVGMEVWRHGDGAGVNLELTEQ